MTNPIRTMRATTPFAFPTTPRARAIFNANYTEWRRENTWLQTPEQAAGHIERAAQKRVRKTVALLLEQSRGSIASAARVYS